VGVFAGPNKENGNLLFLIDGYNKKSVPSNGTLVLLPIQTTLQSSSMTLVDGKIFSNLGDTSRLPTVMLSSFPAMTVETLFDNSSLNQGYLISLNSEESDTFKPFTQTLYSSNQLSTIATSHIDVDINTSASNQTVYSSNQLSTIAASHIDIGINTSASNQTVYSSNQLSTIATSHIDIGINTSASNQTVYSSSSINSSADDIKRYNNNSTNELSIYIDKSGVIVKNKNNDLQTILSYTGTANKSFYSIVFRPHSSVSKPISIYENGILVIESDVSYGDLTFSNLSGSLLSFNNSSHAKYGVSLISVNNNEINSAGVKQNFEAMRGRYGI
jgi:hypothetical protein